MHLNMELKDRNQEVKMRIPAKDDEKEKQKNGTLQKAHEYFKEYCNSTSIHGMGYLAESRSLGERILWVGLICCSLSACIYLILQIYGKYLRSPIIVTFATTETPIHTIPFPAVTICPLTKANKTIFDYTKTMRILRNKQEITEKERRYAKYMTFVCEQDNDIFYNETGYNEDIFLALEELQLKDILLQCSFMNIAFNCKVLFFPIITDEGICYTFNMLERDIIYNKNVVHYHNFHAFKSNSQGWSLDHGYQKISQPDLLDTPYRAFLAGADNSLKIIFSQNFSHNDYLCVQDIQGYNVLLHAPYALPLVKKRFFNVAYGTSVMASVQPITMTTSEKVLQFNPKVRQCYFSTEKKLKYFNIYSPRNCKLECLTNYTLKECGCVSFFMPRENGTKICGNASFKCIEGAERLLKFSHLQEDISSDIDNFFCDCKPLCTDITYVPEVTSSSWDYKKQMEAWDMDKDKEFSGVQYSKLTIYFERDSFLNSERNELYGPTDFIANFGGLLGLFTGFSLLSAAEIIYFLTVRICCNFRLFGQWAGERQTN